jgi:hypothetical protein
MIVYIAGPYRIDPEKACREFERAHRMLLEAGIPAIDPIALTHRFAGLIPEDRFIELDLPLVAASDAILLLEGWEASKGACAEFSTARRNGLEIWFVQGDVIVDAQGAEINLKTRSEQCRANQ